MQKRLVIDRFVCFIPGKKTAAEKNLTCCFTAARYDENASSIAISTVCTVHIKHVPPYVMLFDYHYIIFNLLCQDFFLKLYNPCIAVVIAIKKKKIKIKIMGTHVQ